LYALAYLYVIQNNPQRAGPHARVLQTVDPTNPEYQPLFRSLGLWKGS